MSACSHADLLTGISICSEAISMSCDSLLALLFIACFSTYPHADHFIVYFSTCSHADILVTGFSASSKFKLPR
jgi:hypothetical protein